MYEAECACVFTICALCDKIRYVCCVVPIMSPRMHITMADRQGIKTIYTIDDDVVPLLKYQFGTFFKLFRLFSVRKRKQSEGFFVHPLTELLPLFLLGHAVVVT